MSSTSSINCTPGNKPLPLIGSEPRVLALRGPIAPNYPTCISPTHRPTSFSFYVRRLSSCPRLSVTDDRGAVDPRRRRKGKRNPRGAKDSKKKKDSSWIGMCDWTV